MASQRQAQQEDVRFRIMRLLAENPEMSTRQIATAARISNGAAYYCLTAFIEKGLIKLSNFRSNPRKGQYSYLLTPKGIREKSVLTYRFLERKRQEFEDLKTELEILEEEAGLLNKDLSSSEKQPLEE